MARCRAEPKGYAQFDAGGNLPIEKAGTGAIPDVFMFGLNPNFPSVFSNPFRSPDAGDLVPLPQMMHYGVDASWLRGITESWGRRSGERTGMTTMMRRSMTFARTDDTREAVLVATTLWILDPQRLRYYHRFRALRRSARKVSRDLSLCSAKRSSPPISTASGTRTCTTSR